MNGVVYEWNAFTIWDSVMFGLTWLQVLLYFSLIGFALKDPGSPLVIDWPYFLGPMAIVKIVEFILDVSKFFVMYFTNFVTLGNT